MKLFTLITLATLMTQSFAASVDLAKSSITWTATKKVGGGHTGELKLIKGSVEEKKGKLIGGEFTADINSFSVTDLKGKWAKKFLGHMKSADFFDVTKYPTSVFKISKIKNGKFYGDLIIKGKKKAIIIPYTKKGNNYEGDFDLNRTKFGMVYGSQSFFKGLGDKVINDNVNLKIKLVLKK
jgi:polyisoprenoid-binding protein YceI